MKIIRNGGIMLFLKRGQMDEAVNWFVDKLQGKQGPPLDHLKVFGFRAQAVWVGEQPFRIEVSEPLPDIDKAKDQYAVAMGRQIEKTSPTFGDMVFIVDNLAEWVKALRAKGVKIGDPLRIMDPRFQEIYEAMIHPKSVFGVIVELVEVKGKPPADGTW